MLEKQRNEQISRSYRMITTYLLVQYRRDCGKKSRVKPKNADDAEDNLFLSVILVLRGNELYC